MNCPNWSKWMSLKPWFSLSFPRSISRDGLSRWRTATPAVSATPRGGYKTTRSTSPLRVQITNENAKQLNEVNAGVFSCSKLSVTLMIFIPLTTYAVQAKVLCILQIFFVSRRLGLSWGRFTFWLQSIRFICSLRGAVTRSSSVFT